MAFVKPIRVARFGGTSSTETANSTEPPSGKKDTGWLLSEAPPSSYYNWLSYRVYKWFRWLDERADDGGSVYDLAIHPPTPLASADGGDLELSGSDSGASADLNGGDAIASGGDARGTGSSKSILSAAVAGTPGTTVRVAEPFVTATGQYGSDGLILASKPVDITVPSVNDDVALSAYTYGNGRAIVAQADTTDPASPAVQIVPQDTTTNVDPTGTKSAGDLYVRDADESLGYYNSQLGRYQNLDSIIGCYSDDSDAIIGTSGIFIFEDTGVDILFRIPADTLRVGSIIKVRCGGEITISSANPIPYFWVLAIGATAKTLVQVTPGVVHLSGHWHVEAISVIKVIGSTGSSRSVGKLLISQALTAETGDIDPSFDQPSLPTDANIDIAVAGSWAAATAGDSMTMTFCLVEVQ